jgi:hypothetical protein
MMPINPYSGNHKVINLACRRPGSDWENCVKMAPARKLSLSRKLFRRLMLSGLSQLLKIAVPRIKLVVV